MAAEEEKEQEEQLPIYRHSGLGKGTFAKGFLMGVEEKCISNTISLT